ncbi:universal stress protein [Modestobacter lapidis]|nr:universal stress protein [Modestobacter lapidis]
MTASRPGGPVVVGVTDGDDDAVEWAAAEAATRRCPLVLVHVVRSPVVLDTYGCTPIVDCPPDAYSVGGELLRAALGRARSVAPELAITALMFGGVADRVLVEWSNDAALLVLGGRGVRRTALGSVAGRVAGRASCPVIVVRRRPRTPAPDRGPRVVVGIDAGRCRGAAIEFAFRAAAQRGVPLVAVHAWDGDRPADLEGVCGAPAVAEAGVRQALDRVLGPWREQFADVPVRVRLERADPAAALVSESEGAALVVVGPPGRGPVLRALLGSVSRTLVRRSRCPLAVVGPARTVARRPDAGQDSAHHPR